jgi:hypothetical protein
VARARRWVWISAIDELTMADLDGRRTETRLGRRAAKSCAKHQHVTGHKDYRGRTRKRLLRVSRRARSTALWVARRSAVLARRLGLRRTAPAPVDCEPVKEPKLEGATKLAERGVGNEDETLEAGEEAAKEESAGTRGCADQHALFVSGMVSGRDTGGPVGETEPAE